MTLIGIVGAFRRLIGLAKSNKVRGNNPVTGRREGRDHLAIEVAPCWLAMKAQNGCGPGWSFVNVMHAKGAAKGVINGRKMRRERIVRQIDESIIRRAE